MFGAGTCDGGQGKSRLAVQVQREVTTAAWLGSTAANQNSVTCVVASHEIDLTWM